MKETLVSVIMSTYNETRKELELSIDSILNQSYSNFELIIINDNPKNELLKEVLEIYRKKDNRITIIQNPENIGLVKSLNRALKYSKGQLVARMDADDIAYPDRLASQIQFIKTNHYDLIGSDLEIINETGNETNEIMIFPCDTKSIMKYMKWGSCVPHPTWMVKNDVYQSLDGYRNAPHCEDYDFLLRALAKGFVVGNLPMTKLKYRIRSKSISMSNKIEQRLVRQYLSRNRKKILAVTETDIKNYLDSKLYQKDYKAFCVFENIKKNLKEAISKKAFLHTLIMFFKLIFQRYFYKSLVELIMLKRREKRL